MFRNIVGLNSTVSSIAPCPLSSTVTVCTSTPFTCSAQSVNFPMPTLGPFPPRAALNTSLPPPVLPASFLPPPSYFPNQPHNNMLPFQTPPTIPPTLPPPVFSAIPGIAPSSVPTTVACVTSGSVTPIAQVPAPVPSVSNSSTSTSTKRRFKEEKEEDALPDHLLGYQVCCSANE